MVLTPDVLRMVGFGLLAVAFAIAIIGTTPAQACFAIGVMIVGAAIASNAWGIAHQVSDLLDNMAISIR